MGTGKSAGVSVDAWTREWAWAARARELCAHTVHAKCDTEVPLQHRERKTSALRGITKGVAAQMTPERMQIAALALLAAVGPLGGAISGII